MLFRFSWYRQACGGQYYISVRNMLYTERRIKAIMLLKSGLSLKDVSSSLPQMELNADAVRKMERLLEELHFDLEQISPDDASIVFAVAGYVTKSVNCECFEPPACPINSQYFSEMNRGGWTEPLETVLFLCMVATLTFQHLLVSDKQKQFLSLTHHRAIFVLTLTKKLFKEVPSLCKCTHMNRILFTFYNCLAKNFVNNLNSNIISKTSGVMRKITKLVSSSW